MLWAGLLDRAEIVQKQLLLQVTLRNAHRIVPQTLASIESACSVLETKSASAATSLLDVRAIRLNLELMCDWGNGAGIRAGWADQGRVVSLRKEICIDQLKELQQRWEAWDDAVKEQAQARLRVSTSRSRDCSVSSATLQKAVSDTRAAVATVGRKLIATITPAYEALVEGWYFDNSLTFDTRPLADTIRDAALHLSPGGSTNSAWRDLKTDDGPVSALLASTLDRIAQIRANVQGLLQISDGEDEGTFETRQAQRLIAICFGGKGSEGRAFQVEYAGQNYAMFDPTIKSRNRGHDGTRNFRHLPHPAVTMAGVVPDYGLHVFKLRSVAGMVYTVLAIKLPAAYDALVEARSARELRAAINQHEEAQLYDLPGTESLASCTKNVLRGALDQMEKDGHVKFKQLKGDKVSEALGPLRSIARCFPAAYSGAIQLIEISLRFLDTFIHAVEPLKLFGIDGADLLELVQSALELVAFLMERMWPPMGAGKLLRQIYTTSFHMMIHHTVPEMKSSDDFAIEYGTDWAELNHIYTRLVSYANTFAGTNPKTQDLPQVLQLIIMTNVRRIAAIKAGGERIMQAQKEQAKQRVKDEPIARARLDAVRKAIDSFRMTCRHSVHPTHVELTMDGETCSKVPKDGPAPWHQICQLAPGFTQCPEEWGKEADIHPPASLRCRGRKSVTGMCVGNVDVQGQPMLAEPDVQCTPPRPLLRKAAGSISRQQHAPTSIAAKTLCCEAITGKCAGNSDPTEDVQCEGPDRPGSRLRKNAEKLDRGDEPLEKCCTKPRKCKSGAVVQDDEQCPGEPDDDTQEIVPVFTAEAVPLNAGEREMEDHVEMSGEMRTLDIRTDETGQQYEECDYDKLG